MKIFLCICDFCTRNNQTDDHRNGLLQSPTFSQPACFGTNRRYCLQCVLPRVHGLIMNKYISCLHDAVHTAFPPSMKPSESHSHPFICRPAAFFLFQNTFSKLPPRAENHLSSHKSQAFSSNDSHSLIIFGIVLKSPMFICTLVISGIMRVAVPKMKLILLSFFSPPKNVSK